MSRTRRRNASCCTIAVVVQTVADLVRSGVHGWSGVVAVVAFVRCVVKSVAVRVVVEASGAVGVHVI